MSDVPTILDLDPDEPIRTRHLWELAEQVPKVAQDQAIAIAAQTDSQRAALEVTRANHRNANRILMLLVAAVWSLFAPSVAILIGSAVFHWSATYTLRYAIFVVTIPDLFLSIYNYLRRY